MPKVCKRGHVDRYSGKDCLDCVKVRRDKYRGNLPPWCKLNSNTQRVLLSVFYNRFGIEEVMNHGQWLRLMYLVRAGLIRRTKSHWETTELGTTYAKGIESERQIS